MSLGHHPESIDRIIIKAEFYHSQRKYDCSVISLFLKQRDIKELRIRNHEGEIMKVKSW